MIGIVILNYNTSDDCRKCISFLSNQVGVEVEIIVVDNYSRKDDIEKLSSFCSEQGITLLQSKENKGYSAGNNIGLRYAAEKGYEYAMIINPDMELHQQDYIQKMVTKMDGDHKIALLGTDIKDVDGTHQNPLRNIKFFEEFFWPYEIIRSIFKKDTVYIGDYHTNSDCCKLHGCCFIARLSFIKRIGFLDENTFLYCEEGILAKQVEIHGEKLYYMANIQAFHNHVKSAKGNSVKRMKIFVESRCYYLKNYSGYSFLYANMLCLSRYLQYLIFKLTHSK